MESGEKPPTVAQLRKIGDVYKRPMAIFFMPGPPEGFDAIRDFRSLPDSPPLPQSYHLMLELRRAHARREIALKLAEDLGEELLTVPSGFSASDPPELFASKIRNYLDVSLSKQYSWVHGSAARRAWQKAVENRGVLVFHAPGIELAEMRGFSISSWPFPVIALNAKDTQTGRLFSIIHELTHVLIGDGGLCNDYGQNEHARDIEIYCNAVAGHTLVPTDAFEAEASTPRSGVDIEDGEFERLSRRFGVSREVIARRFLDLGRISTAFYQAKRTQFTREAIRHSEARKAQQKEFRIKQSTLILRDKGEPMARLVLRAYHNDVISMRDVSEYLGMKLKHIDSIQSQLAM